MVQTLMGSEIPSVSRQAQMDAIADAVVMADRAGGTIAVLYGRAPTGLDGEMTTTELLVTWQDRGDARAQREEAISFEPSEPVDLVSEDGPASGDETDPNLSLVAQEDGLAAVAED